MNGNTYIAAYSVCCDGKKNSNDGFNSTFHIKTRFSSGIDVSDIYFSYENKTICSIGIAGYYGVGGISPDVYKWLPVFNDYVAFKPVINLSWRKQVAGVFIIKNCGWQL